MSTREEKFEAMLQSVQREYETTLQKMEKLKGEGKEKTATYRQLWSNKMTLRELLLRLNCG